MVLPVMIMERMWIVISYAVKSNFGSDFQRKQDSQTLLTTCYLWISIVYAHFSIIIACEFNAWFKSLDRHNISRFDRQVGDLLPNTNHWYPIGREFTWRIGYFTHTQSHERAISNCNSNNQVWHHNQRQLNFNNSVWVAEKAIKW